MPTLIPSRMLPALLLLFLPLQAGSQSVTVYRCTDAAGQVTLQNSPCGKGQQQQARRMDVPAAPLPSPLPEPVAPAPASAPAAAAAPAPVPAPVSQKPAPLPPPPLYRCRTWGGKNSYLSEDGSPPKRCEPLAVHGLDGNPSQGGIEACQMREDHCDRIPDEELCEAWRNHDRQAESMVQLQNPDIAEKANALYRRTRHVMTRTLCAE